MDCRRMDEVLDDLVDGTLHGDEAAQAREHLASCPPCRRAEAELRGLLDRAASLPASLEPGRDLWPGIEARLNAGRRPAALPPPARAYRPGLAWAAVLLLALAGLAALVFLKPAPVPRGAAAANPSLVSLRAAEPDYLEARRQLVRALQARRGKLSPETVKVLEENLAVMDHSLAAMKKALEKDPGNRGLADLIDATYRQEIEFLMKADRLPPHV